MTTRNLHAEFKWANRITKHTYRDPINEKGRNYARDASGITEVKCGEVAFSGDPRIAFAKNEDILHNLQIYDKVTTQNHLIAKWAKVFNPPTPPHTHARGIKASITLSKNAHRYKTT